MTEYSPAETGEYPRIFPNFQNYVCCEKDLKDNKHDSLHMAEPVHNDKENPDCFPSLPFRLLR